MRECGLRSRRRSRHSGKSRRGRLDPYEFLGKRDGHFRKGRQAFAHAKEIVADVQQGLGIALTRSGEALRIGARAGAKFSNGGIDPLLSDRSCPVDPFGDVDRSGKAHAALFAG